MSKAADVLESLGKVSSRERSRALLRQQDGVGKSEQAKAGPEQDYT